MPDPLSAAERYRKAATELSDLAKSASNPFFCGYYQRLAQRYFLHAENQMKLSKIESVLAAEPGREDHTLIVSHEESPALSVSSRPASRPPNGRGRRSRSIDLATPGRIS